MKSALFSVPGSAACVFLAELIDATACVHGLLLAGIERMAVGTHFKLQISASRARSKRVATAASHGDFFVFGMNAGFHDCLGRDALFQKNGARSVAAPPLFRKESPFINASSIFTAQPRKRKGKFSAHASSSQHRMIPEMSKESVKSVIHKTCG